MPDYIYPPGSAPVPPSDDFVYPPSTVEIVSGVKSVNDREGVVTLTIADVATVDLSGGTTTLTAVNETGLYLTAPINDAGTGAWLFSADNPAGTTSGVGVGSGNATGAQSGRNDIYTGDGASTGGIGIGTGSSSAGVTGNIDIATGDAVGGASGDITIASGASPTTRGKITVNSPYLRMLNLLTADPALANNIWLDQGHLAISGAAPLTKGVTSITAGSGLTGGTITTTGTIALGNLTGDVTSTGPATTLPTVNANTGTFGDATHVSRVTLNGKGQVTAASAVAITATGVGGSSRIDSQITPASQPADTNEDTLQTYTLPGGTLAANGQAVRVNAWGSFANNTHNKTIRFYFGATSVQFPSSATALAAHTWALEAIIIRTGATSQVLKVRYADTSGTSEVVAVNMAATPAETLSGSVIIRCTGQIAATPTAGDIVQTAMLTEFLA
jgi:hypothetical protein